MSEHEGFNQLDAAKVQELKDINISAAIMRIKRFIRQLPPASFGPDVIFKDDTALEATELLAELYVAGVDFTDEIKPYGWSVREFFLPRRAEALAAQLITPEGRIILWRHSNAEEIVETALAELTAMPGIGGLVGSSRFTWLRTMAYGWGLVRRAFLLKKES